MRQPDRARQIIEAFIALSYLNILLAEGGVFHPTFGGGNGWLRLPIDHPAESRVIARNYILHGFIRDFERTPMRWRRKAFPRVDAAVNGEDSAEALYDDGVAHAEVPTSTVRF